MSVSNLMEVGHAKNTLNMTSHAVTVQLFVILLAAKRYGVLLM